MAAGGPRECCGLLLGDGARIESAVELANVHDDPARFFELDPAGLIAALKAERLGGPKVMGWFHSHPVGQAIPSVEDAGQAANDGRLWAIIAGDDVRLWHNRLGGAVHNRFDPLEWHLF